MRVLLLCSAMFAVGLLVGALIGPQGGAPRRRAPSPATGPGSPRGPAAVDGPARFERASDRGPSATAAGEHSRNADIRGLSAEAAAELDRLVTSERAAPVLSGEGTITGTVRDPAGEPVAGVIVTALPQARPFGLARAARRIRERPHVDRDLADVARDAVQDELWRRYARRTASSGPDGRFALEGLMDARHTVTAFHDRYDVRPLSQQRAVVPDAVVDFVARPVAEVRVEVRMPDGTLADNAWLRWTGPHGRGSDAWVKESPTVRLPIGNCKVKASTWLPEPMESAEVERAIPPGDSADVLVLQLQGRRVLTARLVLPEGFVLPRTVAYRLRRLVDSEEVDPESLLQDPSQRKASNSTPGRAYWFDLEPGRYLVAAFAGRRRLIAHATAEVGEGPAEVELSMSEPGAGTYATVRL
ncbi:MAG: carboxypeptidase-like regulatory domain-containing protein, partial [Planctomycetota bacterium]